MLRSLHRRASKGFTLVELLVVILIVGILAGVAVPIYMNQKTRAYRTSAVMDGHATAATISSGLFGLTSFGDANGTIVVDASVKPATVTVTLGGSGSTSSPSVLYAAMTAGSTASGVTYANTTSWCLDIANNNQHVIYTEAGVSSTQTSCGVTAGANVLPPTVSGGALTSDATYYYQTFLANGTLTVTGSLNVDALIIGGGGSSWNSGGGGGGVLYAPTTAVTDNSYPIVIGGADTNSSFNSLVGLAGGSTNDNGGSGGGGFSGTAGTGTAGQGFAGGVTAGSSGGGGGAGGVGTAGSPGNSNGGVGTSAYSSWGLVTNTGENVAGVVYYAGGGGGWTTGVGGSGGGATYGGRAPIANTGGGGASGNTSGATGIVIIRYLKSAVGD